MQPWLALLRPKQWIKNLFVFAPLLFAHRFGDAGAWVLAITAALAFTSLACIAYIINDIHDREADWRHPVKQFRSLASGKISSLRAKKMALGLAALAILLLCSLPLACAKIAVFYVALNVAYTLQLKKIAVLDVFCIAFCYVLRVLMGGYALGVYVSPWIIITTFLLALFIGFSKRYHELGIEHYEQSRVGLQQYSRELIDRLVVICGASALITYAIYSVEMGQQTGRTGLVYSAVFVAFGLFRYLQSVYVFKQGGEPESIVLRDKVQLVNGVLWLMTTLWIGR